MVTNHILQSTIFAVVAGLLTLFLRNNHARTRYWIWLAASLKFLIPFSLFVELGHRLTWSTALLIAQMTAPAAAHDCHRYRYESAIHSAGDAGTNSCSDTSDPSGHLDLRQRRRPHLLVHPLASRLRHATHVRPATRTSTVESFGRCCISRQA